MCGIAGIFNDSEAIPDASLIAASIEAMKHRGPDGSGQHIEAGAALAHARLSLIDLSNASSQPFHSNDGRYVLVYNGEIYNYQELRADLEKDGARFTTSGDTEVLLQCLIQNGVDDTVRRLEGMFAFALYDRQKRRLTLARDRLGIKPLFVAWQDNQFAFASEVGALRPWVPLKASPTQLAHFVSGGHAPISGSTFYEGIHSVHPGTIVEVDRPNTPVFRRYFRLADLCDRQEINRIDHLSPSQAVDEVEELLLNSVRMRMIADVPVGAFCSGGVDSSLIMALASKVYDNLTVFHADVVGPGSERSAAELMARHLKLEMHTVEVTDDDFLETFADATRHYGHPFLYHPNSIPFLAVARLVQQKKYKAVLSGEGSDECYVGYPRYVFNVKSFIWEKLKKSLAAHLLELRRPIATMDPLSNFKVSPGLLSGFEQYDEDQANIAALQDATGRPLKSSETYSMRLLNYHLQTLLHRNDCMGMAASIEARFPLLYTKHVGFAANCPTKFKTRFSVSGYDGRHPFVRDKWVLRALADRHLPKEMSRRRKLGFPVSAVNRMQVDSRLFDGSYVADFLKLSDKDIGNFFSLASQRDIIRLVFLEVWARVCLHGQHTAATTSWLREHVSVRPQ